MTSRVHRSCTHARLLRCSTPLQVAAMALLRYFQVTASLPTAEDTILVNTVTQSENAAVLREVQAERPRKRKAYTVFSEWYTQEVSKQLEAGTQVEEVHVDMRMSVMKELSSRWFISAYDHIQSNPDIVKNGFKKAGITEALETGLPEADAELDLQDLSENDPFSSDSD